MLGCLVAHSSDSHSHKQPSAMHAALRTISSLSCRPPSMTGHSWSTCGRMNSEQPSTETPNAMSADLRWAGVPAM